MGYETLIIEPVKNMMLKILSYFPTIFIALVIFTIGILVSQLLRSLFLQLFKVVEFDVLSEKIGLTGFLTKGGIKDKPSELLTCIFHWIMMVVVLLTTVKSLGLIMVSDLIDTVLAYVPHVVTGVLVLTIGMLVAKFIAAMVYLLAKNTDMPIPATLSRLTKLVIMVYVAIVFLKEIGLISLFTGTHYTIFMGGVVFAFALAFGLAGKDIASKYLGVFSTKKIA